MVKGEYIPEITSIVNQIVAHYKPQKIILFGSFSRGDNHQDSDIDLLVVKDTNEKKHYRIKQIFESINDINREFPLDVIVYTPSELKERLSLGDFFIKRILSEGKVLYEQ